MLYKQHVFPHSVYAQMLSPVSENTLKVLKVPRKERRSNLNSVSKLIKTEQNSVYQIQILKFIQHILIGYQAM